jgi:phosphoribosyl-ATP pyrophosphohydrolase/phosphoribosyl-AMP cyclohydrolase
MNLEFNKNGDGLLPVIIQDGATEKVLMLGYMNDEAYKKTCEQKRVVFYSRSKQRLWMKGETSGNYLEVNEILPDCDNDCLLIKVNPAGPVCHTGADTCFDEKNTRNNFLTHLESIIADRKSSPSPGSYTSTLFQKGINKIAQKIGEEATELIIEAKDTNDDLFLNEAADLLFHFLILLQAKKKRLSDVTDTLEKRHLTLSKMPKI